ncbi:Dipeptide/tripeptide permease (PTR2) (PDB:2XUT) [Commensalibacter communis]|uniref:peptide MFS transporter n=1 Tax=Commensalibacter communis TaxID=2972786 RepID=UPI0022FF6454|nr:oligopeptide:H+ symporter [Commensalibacter communis]CAI3942382.1 Dipeptide/tripeptide permease (PTR2) (PDB:2XUT) [Commensalibacter communis]
MASTLLKQKNNAFSVVLFIELWERFGYYGMQSILALFLSQHMKFSDYDANLLIAAFGTMTYAAPALGGWIGDKILGNQRAMLYGSIILALGYLLLASAMHYTGGIYITMAIISTGNGLFKPNAATLVRRIYEDDDSQLDVAFTLYYMAVNVGSTISMLLCPYLKDHYGWDAAFIACFVGLLLGIINYSLTKKRLASYVSSKDQQPISASILTYIFLGIIASIAFITVIITFPEVAQWCVIGAAILILAFWVQMYFKIDSTYRSGLRIVYLLTFEGMLYYVFYQQMSTSLTFFALRNVDLSFSIGSYHLFDWSPGQFQALNPIWIMLLSPLLAKLYATLGRKQKDFSIATKFIAGFFFVAIGFFIWWIACVYNQTSHVSSWIMVSGYFFLSLGELLTSGLGLAVVARYVPASINGFMTGSYLMASGVAMYIGGIIANIAAPPDMNNLSSEKTLIIYQGLFLNLLCLAGIALVILLLFLPILRKWNKQYKQDMFKQ